MKRAGGDAGGPECWPAGLPGFRETALRYYDALDALAQAMLPLYATALDLPPGHFAPLCDQPLTNLRFTHYPPATYGANQFGIAPHSDSSFFTLLAQNQVPGLQLRTTDGTWFDVPVIPEQLRGQHRRRAAPLDQRPLPVDAAPCLQPSAGPRYAIPYFFPPQPRHADRRAARLRRRGRPAALPGDDHRRIHGLVPRSNYDHFRGRARRGRPRRGGEVAGSPELAAGRSRCAVAADGPARASRPHQSADHRPTDRPEGSRVMPLAPFGRAVYPGRPAHPVAARGGGGRGPHAAGFAEHRTAGPRPDRHHHQRHARLRLHGLRHAGRHRQRGPIPPADAGGLDRSAPTG